MHAVLSLMHAFVVPTEVKKHLQQTTLQPLKKVIHEVSAPHAAVNGKWHLPANSKTIPDPYNGEPFVKVPDPQVRFVSS